MDDLDRLIDQELMQPSDHSVIAASRRRRPSRIANENRATKILEDAAGSANRQIQRKQETKAMQLRAREDAFKNFEDACGGREALISILEHCSHDSPAYKGITKLFSDYDFKALGDATLQIICRRNGVSLAQLMIAFKEATAAQLVIHSIARLAEHTPKVIDQIAEDATNRFDDCPVCLGEARVPRIADSGEWALDENGEQRTQLCYNCRGTGKIHKEHDFSNRKLFLEIVGILPQSGKGPSVQFNQALMVKGDFAEGSFEHLIKSIDNRVAVKALPDLDVETVPYSAFEDGADQPITMTDPAQSSEGNQG